MSIPVAQTKIIITLGSLLVLALGTTAITLGTRTSQDTRTKAASFPQESTPPAPAISPAQLFLIDPANPASTKPIASGSVLYFDQLPAPFSFLIQASEHTQSVQTLINGQSFFTTNQPPFLFSSQSLGIGSSSAVDTVTFLPFSQPNGQGSIGSPITISIIGSR